MTKITLKLNWKCLAFLKITDLVSLRNKKSYASIEGAKAFGEKFFLGCVNQGVLKAKRIYFILDGARWIRRLKDNYFPEAIGFSIFCIWRGS